MTMYLYRKWRQTVTLAALLAALSPGLAGQFRAPQPERKTPRAVGVLETDENGNRRLIPVTFFYERHYYDATFYHATPVPFTLARETVYEVQQFGKPLGVFTVQSATRNEAEWWGNGHFKIVPDASALARKKAAKAVVVEDSSRPVLHRREGSEGDHPAASVNRSAPEVEDDPDRPKLHRREGSESGAGSDASAQRPTAPASSTAAGQTQSQENSGQDADRPVLHRRDDAGDGTAAASAPKPEAKPQSNQETAQPVAAAVSAAAEPTPDEEADHPILRRGKPVEEQSGRDLPEFQSGPKGGKATLKILDSATGGPSGGLYPQMGGEPVVRQVAVSDAGASEPEDVIFVCRQEQREQMETSASELAQAELRRVAAMRGLTIPEEAGAGVAKSGAEKSGAAKAKPGGGAKSGAKAGTHTGQSMAEAATAPALTLEDEQFVPYDLDYNNYATVVFSARYRPGAAVAGSGNASLLAAGAQAGNASLPAASAEAGAGAGALGESWVVTVIARQDEDKLIKLYGAVSDPRELDLYPEVRLVDAVDPDGYGRYALLFREQKRDGVSWLLGRVTGYELQTLFETASR